VIGLGAAAGIVGVALQSEGGTTTTAAGAHCVQGANRFACGSSDARFDWWREAWQSFEDEPLAGTGAGSFELSHRLRRAHFTRPVTEPHNLALQALGETGIVGFALFAGAVALAVLAIRRRALDDAARVLVLCALAYLLHVLIDVGYDFVAVSAPVLVIVGVLISRPSPPPARREPLWALGAVAFAATATLSLAAPYISERKLDEAARTGDPGLAAEAHDWDPVSIGPLQLQAVLEETRRNDLKALQLYRQAVDTQPENPDAWLELGRFELEVRQDACAAYRALNEAYTLDRFNTEISARNGLLDRARRQVNAGACGGA
jgi:hypothetical protein